MASDKRTVLSTKRARDRRQRATRRADKKSHAAVTPTVAGGGVASDAPTSSVTLEPLTRKSSVHVAPGLAVHHKLDEPTSSGDDRTHNSSSGEDCDLSDDDDDVNQCDDGCESDDELVIVRRAAAPDFCAQFVSLEQLSSVAPTRAGSKRCREFSAAVPRFRDTSDGFTTYTIELTTRSNERFELERRFSEFVALAAALQRDDVAANAAADSPSSSSSGYRPCDTSDSGAVQWELPPKTWFRVTQPSALEERRRQLEQSLTRLLAMDAGAMSRRALVRDFLLLDVFGAQAANDTVS